MKSINDNTIEKSIKYRINAHPSGWCMSPSHFADLGSDGAIRISLYRLAKKGIIRRVSKGIYECPRKHEHLGILSPSIDKIAQAIAERDDIQIQPSGAYAANLLCLSEQVPAKVVFVTNGPSKKIKIDKMEIVFRHTTNKNVLFLQYIIQQEAHHALPDSLSKSKSFVSINQNRKYAGALSSSVHVIRSQPQKKPISWKRDFSWVCCLF